jgi:transcriptional regulator with XRE-family HTH domain
MAEPLTFGSRLRSLRDAAGMTQEQLAVSVGITPLSLLRYENDQRVPRWDDVLRIAKALGVSVAAFEESASDDDQGDDAPDLPPDDPPRGKRK